MHFSAHYFKVRNHEDSNLLHAWVGADGELENVGVNSPYLVLEIRRDHIIHDALYQVHISLQLHTPCYKPGLYDYILH